MSKHRELLAQKRAGDNSITKNAYTAARYRKALEACGFEVSSTATKTELWKRVKGSAPALSYLQSTRGW